MAAHLGIEPVAAPHKTKRFWLLVAAGLLIPLAAPLFLIGHGMRPFPIRVQLTSGAISFTLWTVFIWLLLRFGRLVLFAIAVFVSAFALYAMRHV